MCLSQALNNCSNLTYGGYVQEMWWKTLKCQTNGINVNRGILETQSKNYREEVAYRGSWVNAHVFPLAEEEETEDKERKA